MIFAESLKAFEASLKEKHEKAAAEAELKKKKELEERQQVFHEAFKTDLEIYKNFGTIPSKFSKYNAFAENREATGF